MFSVEESLKRLQTDYIDLYQVWTVVYSTVTVYVIVIYTDHIIRLLMVGIVDSTVAVWFICIIQIVLYFCQWLAFLMILIQYFH